MSRTRFVSLLRFGCVGFFGFLVDAGVVFFCGAFFNSNPILSRIPAWVAAVSITYVLNSRFTFNEKKSQLRGNRTLFNKYLLYVSSQFLGGCINVGVFSILVHFSGMNWFVSIVAGTLCGLMINFLGASLAIKNKI